MDLKSAYENSWTCCVQVNRSRCHLFCIHFSLPKYSALQWLWCFVSSSVAFPLGPHSRGQLLKNHLALLLLPFWVHKPEHLNMCVCLMCASWNLVRTRKVIPWKIHYKMHLWQAPLVVRLLILLLSVIYLRKGFMFFRLLKCCFSLSYSILD